MTNDARPRRPTALRGRALLALAALALGVAGVLAVVAVRSGGPPDGVVLDVEDAVAAIPPSTIAPFEDGGPIDSSGRDGTPRGDAADGGPGDRAASGATVPLSPLADLVGERGSAIPEVVEPRLRPVDLAIAALDLYGPVRAVGLEDDGQLEIPDETEIGWYEYGASPGRPGATVLAAHVTWNGTVGPFRRLGELAPGDRVEVGLADGSHRTYEVTERTMYDKDSLPRDRIWRTSGDESLVLITCGGSFNPEIRRYRQNIVVYAAPVA